MRLVLAALCLSALPLRAETVTIFAAASLGGALEEAVAGWEAQSGHEAVIAAAGSATLARQIDLGAPADVFVSANAAWMDWLEGRGRVDADTRRDLAGNALVLVAGGPGGEAVEVTAGFELLDMLGDGRLAIALVDAVPAGIYGKQALQAVGLWDGVADRLAQTDNVRAALALVALGEAPLGVVYATDALAEPSVRIAGRFPPDSHEPITYPAAVVSDSPNRDVAGTLLDWLGGEAAQAVLAAHGFEVAR